LSIDFDPYRQLGSINGNGESCPTPVIPFSIRASQSGGEPIFEGEFLDVLDLSL
jgi:hypothetical protein